MSKKHKYRVEIEEVRKMTDEELGLEIETQRSKLFTARSQSVTEKVEDVSQFGEYKRNIARLLTEQQARRPKAAAKPAPAAAPAKKAPARRPARRTAAKGATKPAAKAFTK